MTAYILVKAQDGWNPSDPMVYMTGYPVLVSSRNQYGGDQVPPKFCQVEITDADPAEVEDYCREWLRQIDYEFIGHDYALDGHRLRVFVKPELVSASGLGSLTRDQVEAYLTQWKAAVQSVAPNSVVFDITVYDAVTSDGFWLRDVSGIVFNEVNYNESTGVHRVRATYSAVPEMVSLPDVAINQYIEERGGSIVQHVANTRVTFDIGRDSVFNWFKLDVAQRVDGIFARRKWAFTQAAVDAAIAGGGTLTVTRQQALEYLHNRLLD